MKENEKKNISLYNRIGKTQPHKDGIKQNSSKLTIWRILFPMMPACLPFIYIYFALVHCFYKIADFVCRALFGVTFVPIWKTRLFFFKFLFVFCIFLHIYSRMCQSGSEFGTLLLYSCHNFQILFYYLMNRYLPRICFCSVRCCLSSFFLSKFILLRYNLL